MCPKLSYRGNFGAAFSGICMERSLAARRFGASPRGIDARSTAFLSRRREDHWPGPLHAQKDRVSGCGITFIRSGRLVRYHQSDVDAFLASLPNYRSTAEYDRAAT